MGTDNFWAYNGSVLPRPAPLGKSVFRFQTPSPLSRARFRFQPVLATRAATPPAIR
jgi:hypothetical protein